MIELGVVQDCKNRTGCAGFRVPRPKNHTPQARLNNCSGTHRARLNCSIESAVRQAVVLQTARRAPQRENFRMSGGIVQVNRPVMSAGDHSSVSYYDCAHGDFPLVTGSLRLAKSQAHELLGFRIRG